VRVVDGKRQLIRQGDRTDGRPRRNGGVNHHDFTPYYSSLRHLYLPGDDIEIAHHFNDVSVGDTIRWGESYFEALVYEVASVRTLPTLVDLWFARCRRVWPEIWVAGKNYPCSSTNLAIASRIKAD
jgi:hypothetical protein